MGGSGEFFLFFLFWGPGELDQTPTLPGVFIYLFCKKACCPVRVFMSVLTQRMGGSKISHARKSRLPKKKWPFGRRIGPVGRILSFALHLQIPIKQESKFVLAKGKKQELGKQMQEMGGRILISFYFICCTYVSVAISTFRKRSEAERCETKDSSLSSSSSGKVHQAKKKFAKKALHAT